MDKDERARLKEKILSELEQIEKDVASLTEQAKPIPPDSAIGRLTRMEAIQAKSVAEAVLNETKIKRSKLEAALGRVDGDGYGVCCDCEEDIPIARMELVPESVRCVHCAERR